MKLLITADLHYNISRSQGPSRRLAGKICKLRADGLLVLGDVGGRDLQIVREALRLFEAFEGCKYFVAGNHDIWANPGEDSFDRYRRVLPDLCREVGFHPLDVEPAILGGIGLAGSIGWYDYSFRAEELGVPLRFYEAKISPGAASRLPGYEQLLVETSDISDLAMEAGTRWMDGQHVRMEMSDLEFCEHLVRRLAAHLDQLSAECESIVVGMHHLPFRQMVPINHRPGWAFARAYLGADRFGRLLLKYPKVKYVYSGHTHRVMHTTCGHIRCVDVGSTYICKRYEALEI